MQYTAFLLQTPRDGKAFCSLSLVNRERTHCGGMFIGDDHYSLDNLLSGQPYLNRHPKVPRDFAVLPFQILVHHVEETLEYVQRLMRELTSTEKRIAEGSISLDDNGDYKLLNRLNLEHLRLQRRSNFEVELAENLTKYVGRNNILSHTDTISVPPGILMNITTSGSTSGKVVQAILKR
jgi:hypothetical protein